MPNEDVEKICGAYDLGTPVGAQENIEGVLNKNYILETSKGTFFIKSIRPKRKDHLSYIYAVESFMKSKGIKAVTMLHTLSGDISIQLRDNLYTVYDFIESDRSHEYSLPEYSKMGVLLGEIHRAGSKDVPTELLAVQYTYPPKDVGIEKLQKFKKLIEEKAEMSDTDKQFLQYLDLKLSLVPTLDKEVAFTNDMLIHGDYHYGNLLFDPQSKEIIGICDWEQAGMFPRAYEVARSLLYVCFEDKFEINEALEKAKVFLSGYNSIFPLSVEELQTGFDLRTWRMVISVWIEEKFYERGDGRGNKFVSHEISLLDLFVQHKFDIGRLF